MKLVDRLGDGVPQPAWRVLQRKPYERMGQIETLEAELEATKETLAKLMSFMVESSLMSLDQAKDIVGNYDYLEVFVEPDSPPTPAPTPPPYEDDDIPF